MTDCSSRPLRRAEASEYLLERHGIQRRPATLAKLAVIGGGPVFRRAGRVPIYSLADLDDFAASITSVPVHSTSELLNGTATYSGIPTSRSRRRS